MHQTSVRPAPFTFTLPPTPQSPRGIDGRKETRYLPTLPKINQSRYIEAPVRVGLRTPPEDDMHATYPEPSHLPYKSRQNETYPGPFKIGRTPEYDASTTRPAQPPHIQEASGAPASRTNGSKDFSQPDVPFSWPPIKEKAQADSFQPAPLSALESESTRKPQAKKPSNTDSIHPSLRIPESINDSGGSLAEFAAQVIISSSIFCLMHGPSLTFLDYLFILVWVHGYTKTGRKFMGGIDSHRTT